MQDLFQRESMKIAVIGQGYVGLPLSLLFVNKGFQVFGIDLDKGKIDSLRQGRSYLPDVTDKEITDSNHTGRFVPTDRYDSVSEAEAIIICVPTPLTTSHLPDLTILERAVAGMAKFLRKGHCVILESSTYPGTTREIVKPILEKESGLVAGTDFYLGYSPERIDPGNETYKVENIPKLISGITPSCIERISNLYARAFQKVVSVSSPEVAEMSKLLENSHRLINISFINEIATICDALNIDIWEVIEAAKTKPFGFTAYYPGPGIGGHCIPVDPLYLQWKAQEEGISSRFIQLSDEINRSIPSYLASRVNALLRKHSAPANANVLIYGVTYKKDVNDVRESPVLDLIFQLQASGYTVSYHDPYVPSVKLSDTVYYSIEVDESNLRNAHCVIIATDHSVIPIRDILAYAPMIYDARNITAGLNGNGKVYRIGTGLSASV